MLACCCSLIKEHFIPNLSSKTDGYKCTYPFHMHCTLVQQTRNQTCLIFYSSIATIKA